MRRIFPVFLCALLGVLPILQAADNNGATKKDAASLINNMRLKRMTKELELNEDQQKKVMVLFEEESKVTANYRENPNMSVPDRNAKIKEAQEVTYSKLKPLLTPPQLDKFEKILAQASKPKRKQ